MPLRQFLQMIARQSRVSVVAQSVLDDKGVTLYAYDQPVSQVMAAVARRMGVELNVTNGMYYLGRLKSEDRAIMVRHVRRLKGEDLQAALSGVLSNEGTVRSFSDGLTVITDRVEILARVVVMLDEIESAASPVWVVQGVLLSMNEEQRDAFNLDIAPTADLAVTLAGAALGGPTTLGTTAAANGTFQAVMEYARTDEARAVIAEPLFILKDGEKGRIHSGQRIPIPRRALTESGAVQTVDFSYETTGLTLEVELREQSAELAGVDFTVRLNELVGFEEGAPITSGSEFETSTVMRSGGIYLLGQISEDERILGSQGGTLVGRKNSSGARSLQIWARAHRISVSPLIADPSASPAASRVDEASEDARRDGDRGEEETAGRFERLPVTRG